MVRSASGTIFSVHSSDELDACASTDVEALLEELGINDLPLVAALDSRSISHSSTCPFVGSMTLYEIRHPAFIKGPLSLCCLMTVDHDLLHDGWVMRRMLDVITSSRRPALSFSEFHRATTVFVDHAAHRWSTNPPPGKDEVLSLSYQALVSTAASLGPDPAFSLAAVASSNLSRLVYAEAQRRVFTDEKLSLRTKLSIRQPRASKTVSNCLVRIDPLRSNRDHLSTLLLACCTSTRLSQDVLNGDYVLCALPLYVKNYIERLGVELVDVSDADDLELMLLAKSLHKHHDSLQKAYVTARQLTRLENTNRPRL